MSFSLFSKNGNSSIIKVFGSSGLDIVVDPLRCVGDVLIILWVFGHSHFCQHVINPALSCVIHVGDELSSFSEHGVDQGKSFGSDIILLTHERINDSESFILEYVILEILHCLEESVVIDLELQVFEHLWVL